MAANGIIFLLGKPTPLPLPLAGSSQQVPCQSPTGEFDFKEASMINPAPVSFTYSNWCALTDLLYALNVLVKLMFRRTADNSSKMFHSWGQHAEKRPCVPAAVQPRPYATCSKWPFGILPRQFKRSGRHLCMCEENRPLFGAVLLSPLGLALLKWVVCLYVRQNPHNIPKTGSRICLRQA